jgi:hypothetical protein
LTHRNIGFAVDAQANQLRMPETGIRRFVSVRRRERD